MLNKERKLCAHPRLEIYQRDQIYFMCPLARQGDFYVPEVKETDRKSRWPLEDSDAQVDSTGTRVGECSWGPSLDMWAWLRRLLPVGVGTVRVQAKLARGGGRRPSHPRTHMQSCLSPDTWVPVDVGSHITPDNSDTKTLLRFSSDIAGVPLETPSLDAHGRGFTAAR